MGNHVWTYTPIEKVPAYRAIALGKVTMKKAGIVSFGILFALFVFIAAGSKGGEKKAFTLKEDLTIGVESGDENLMFGSVADIGLDASGNIFILDWGNSRIHQASTQRIALVFPFLTILESGSRLYVTVLRQGGEGPNELIVYENDKPVGILPVGSMPRAVDSQGRIYCAEESDYPRLVRYVVK